MMQIILVFLAIGASSVRSRGHTTEEWNSWYEKYKNYFVETDAAISYN